MSHVKLSMLGNKSRSKHSKRAFTKRLKTRELTLGDMYNNVIVTTIWNTDCTAINFVITREIKLEPRYNIYKQTNI